MGESDTKALHLDVDSRTASPLFDLELLLLLHTRRNMHYRRDEASSQLHLGLDSTRFDWQPQ